MSRHADLELLLAALAFAAERHRDQRRKGMEASPYINHPIAVARLLQGVGGVDDARVLAAALLHDTVEDTRTSFEELEDAFGPAVAEIVREVTDDTSLPREARKAEQVRHAPHLSRGARLVKLADKVINLGDVLQAPPAGWSAARKAEYFDWAREVVDHLRGANAALEARFDALYARRGELLEGER